MLDITPTLKFVRFQQPNGQHVFGVYGQGRDFQNFVHDLTQLDITVVEPAGAVKPWIHWSFNNKENELDFVLCYEDTLVEDSI